MQILNVAGGKARIASWIVECLPPHQVYVEAFGGSGAVLIAKSPSAMEIFNDRDGGLVHFFEVLATRPGKLIKRFDGLFYSAFRDPTPTRDPVEIAARFFLHNNTTWAVANGNSFRRQTRPDKDGRTVAIVFQKRKKHLDKVAERLKRVIFENRNALDIIRQYDGPDVLHYVDPPYYGPRRNHLYEHEMMDEASHRELASVLHNARGSVVLSGYASELYKELYGDWQIAVRRAQTNAKDHRQECLWIKPTQDDPKFKPEPRSPRIRSAAEITRRAIREAASSPLTGQLGWHKQNGEKRCQREHAISLKERAKMNGVSASTQHRLDKIASRHPELLKRIATGELSTIEAFHLCEPALSIGGLYKLRAAWKIATVKEREIFRAEINESAPK